MPKISSIVLSLGCVFFWMGTAHSQAVRAGREWMTMGGDAQRSSWIRADPKISAAALRKPGFQLAWQLRLKGEPTFASTFDRFYGYRGARSFAFVGNTSGELTAIDSDLGRIEWQKKPLLRIRGEGICLLPGRNDLRAKTQRVP